MPSLDTCINNLYEPGNIGSSSGQPPTVTVTVTSSAATFAGAGSFRGNATKRKNGDVTFAGAGSLRITMTQRHSVRPQFNGDSGMSVDALINP